MYVTCAPQDRMQEAELRVRRNGADVGQRMAGDQNPWEVALEAAQTPYEISAAFAAANQPVLEQLVVRPPSRNHQVKAP